MVSVAEKAHRMRQVGTEKANVSEPPLNCRKRSDDIETRVQLLPWDEPGGCLLTGLVVSGTKVARARFRLQCGTWERLAPMGSASCWRVLEWPARGRAPSSGNCEGRSTDAGQAGGPSCSSGDAW